MNAADPFKEGQAARLEARPRSENPYGFLTREYAEWNIGYDNVLRPYPLTRSEWRDWSNYYYKKSLQRYKGKYVEPPRS